MASIELEISEDNTEAIKEAVKQAIQTSLEAIGLLAEGYAKKLCPVDTGRLRNSITHGAIPDENTAYIATNVEYAAYVEYGTSKMAAQPYFKPAINDNQAEYKATYEEYLRNA